MFLFSFFTPPQPSSISTLSLHDALPICFSTYRDTKPAERSYRLVAESYGVALVTINKHATAHRWQERVRSEEHTSELQSRGHLVCRLLLEKKNRRTE